MSCSRTQHGGGRSRTPDLSLRSPTLYHWATALPGSYSERTLDYDIIYRTLHGKPFSVNYPFYPIYCFWFLTSNLQCQNLLFFLCLYNDILGYQTFMTITRSNPISAVILGKSIFGYFLYPGHLFTAWCHLVLVCTWVWWSLKTLNIEIIKVRCLKVNIN